MEFNGIIALLAGTLPKWVTTLFPILQVIFVALIALSALLLIIFVFMQEANNSGLGAIGGGAEDSFYAQNKGDSKEGRLKRWTYILAGLIFICSVLYFICEVIYPAQ